MSLVSEALKIPVFHLVITLSRYISFVLEQKKTSLVEFFTLKIIYYNFKKHAYISLKSKRCKFYLFISFTDYCQYFLNISQY